MKNKENIVAGILAILSLALAIFFILVSLCGCQSYSHKEYYKELDPATGKQLIKSEEEREGMLPWSEGKTFNIKATGAGI